MAYVPNQQLTVVDPGLGLVPEAASTYAYFGTSSSGTVDELVYYNSKKAVVDTLGQGPLAESLCTHLAIAGGPVIGIKVDETGNEGTTTVGTPVRVGSATGTITLAGDPYDAYEGLLEITSTTEFRYSLDAGASYSPSILIPSGLSYVIPNTGVTVTFVPGAGPTTWQAGDVLPFTTTANHYDVSALATAMQILIDSNEEIAAVVLTGQEADTSDGATMFAALSAHMTSLSNVFKFCGALVDSGSAVSGSSYDFATTKSDLVNSINARIGICFSDIRMVSQKPMTGWGVIKRPFRDIVSAWAGAQLISTHLGRFASGPPPALVSANYDEYKNGQGMSAAGFIVPRTWPGAGGIYINRGNLRSPVGSDFQIWPFRRIMDTACDVTAKALQPFANTKIRVDGTGRIDPKEAARIESRVNNALSETLKTPTDAEGNKGHVSEVLYRVDLEANVQATNRVSGNVAVVPDGYAEKILTALGFAATAE